VKQQARPTSVCQCGWAHAVKRAADIMVALIGIVVMSPVLAAVGAVIWVTMGGPVLFRQVRPGKYAKPFLLLKFRTMLESCDSSGKLMPDAQRLTRVGLWLRATSIDELPQLWTRSCQALPGGPRLKAAMRSTGTRKLRSIHGMWTTGRCGLMRKSCSRPLGSSCGATAFRMGAMRRCQSSWASAPHPE
jgi:hypothetical protein